MRKSAYDICEQQRRKSASAVAQSDQRPCCSLVYTFAISRLWLVTVAEQAGLSLT